MVDESIEPAQWGEPVSDEDGAAAERALGAAIPSAWRAHLQREPWLRAGWLESGDYVECYGPGRAVEMLGAWGEAAARHPGMYPLGGDGSRNLYCVDLREEEPPVGLADIVSSGWQDVEPLLPSVEAFVEGIRAGTFRAYPEQ